jgi:ribonuclease HepT-like protein
MLRVLEIYGEPLPRGRTWHADLLRLATTPGPALTAGGGAAGRPPFAPALAAKLDRLRRFRHVAMHGYPNFDVPPHHG